MDNKSCPSCEITWEREESITEHFIADYHENGIPERLLKLGLAEVSVAASNTASMYGCRPGTPRHFAANLLGVETDEYDGVTWWVCTSCGIGHHRLNPKKTTTEFQESVASAQVAGSEFC